MRQPRLYLVVIFPFFLVTQEKVGEYVVMLILLVVEMPDAALLPCLDWMAVT
jgi:hypothetical protein